MIQRRYAVLTLATAAALAGCGGSSGLSKADLASKANAICASYQAKGDKIAVPDDFETNPVSAAKTLDKVVALADQEFAELKKLKPAKDVKADYTAWLAAGTHEFTLLKSADTKARAKDASGLQDLQQAQTLKAQARNPISRRLGFTTCLK